VRHGSIARLLAQQPIEGRHQVRQARRAFVCGRPRLSLATFCRTGGKHHLVRWPANGVELLHKHFRIAALRSATALPHTSCFSPSTPGTLTVLIALTFIIVVIVVVVAAFLRNIGLATVIFIIVVRYLNAIPRPCGKL